MISRFSRGIATAFLAYTLAACGDSTAPVTLNDEQIDDMMDAIAGIGAFNPPAGAVAAARNVLAAVVSFSESVECPSGGTTSVSGSFDDGGASNSFSAQFTQGFSNCKAESSSGRLWTFNGDPNLAMTFTGTFNETTGAFSLSGTQKGGIAFSSDIGSGKCAIDVTFSISGDENTFSGSISGTVCGKSVSQSLSVS